MKKLIVILALFALSFPLVCQTEDLAEQKTETEQINPKTGFPEIQHKPFVVFNEGAAFANVTRIETQSSRNNYVWQNSMIGAFFEFSQRICVRSIQLSGCLRFIRSITPSTT